MITDNDKYLFTTGGCLILADRISRETGWAVCAIENDDPDDDYYEDFAGPHVHAFNLLPDGRYLDVEGIKTYEEVLERWSMWHPTGIGEYEVEDFDWGWCHPGEGYRLYENRADEIANELIESAMVPA